MKSVSDAMRRLVPLAAAACLLGQCVSPPKARRQEWQFSKMSAVEARETRGMTKAVLLIQSKLSSVHLKTMRGIARATLGPKFIPTRYADHLIESTTGIIDGGRILLEAWRFHAAEIISMIPDKDIGPNLNLSATLASPMRLDPKIRYKPTHEIIAELKEQKAVQAFLEDKRKIDPRAYQSPSRSDSKKLSWMSTAFGRVLKNNNVSHLLIMYTDLTEEAYSKKRHFTIRSIFVNPTNGKWRFLTISTITKPAVAPNFASFFKTSIQDHMNKISLDLR